jgi:hypothetical protein
VVTLGLALLAARTKLGIIYVLAVLVLAVPVILSLNMWRG